MVVHIEIKKTGQREFYYISKEVDGVELWLTKKRELRRYKGERAAVSQWKHATQLVEQILNGDIS